jgi:hypothetical protein
MIYRIRYALHLWRNVPGLGLLGALRYPCDPTWGDGDPIEDAEAEISEMCE